MTSPSKASGSVSAQPAWFVGGTEPPPGNLATCGLPELLRLMGMPPADAADQALRLPVRRVPAGATLFHEGTDAEFIYVVRCGTFKCSKVAVDGYEQVLDFPGKTEVLGFKGVCSGRHPTTVTALEDGSVYVLPVAELNALRARFPSLDRALQIALSRQLNHVSEIAEMMAAVAAEVRLARFLVQLSARMTAWGESATRLRLRMCRRDLASHLGVAHETVSRSFGSLAECGYLTVNNREVEILDLAGLKACARSTRGFGDELPRRSLPQPDGAANCAWQGTMRHSADQRA